AVKDIIERLNLTGIKAIVGRAEDIAKKPEYRNQYEVIVSRAVAPLDELIVWSKDLRKPGAIMYALKGGNLMEEIERAKKLNGVMEVSAKPIALKSYDEFVTEEKQIITVKFKN